MIQGLNLQFDPATLREPQDAAPAILPAAFSPQDLVSDLAQLLGPRWEVLECLALGGMAAIFLIQHRTHRGLLVAKVLRPELMQRAEVVLSFQGEAEHAARLGGHPNAVAVLDFLKSDKLLALLMPFVDGEDLDCFLRRHGPLPRADALQFAAQIASLLAFAESHGIAHGDLSTGNIRLDTFGRYRVLDLGLSHARDGYTPAKALGGTPLYTSPEQIRGEAPDARTDVYALGLLLVEVLTGAPLFAASSLDEIRHCHLRGYTTFPAPVSGDPKLTRLLEKMLARERTQRFQSTLELTRALAGMGFQPPELMRPLPDGRRARLSTDPA